MAAPGALSGLRVVELASEYAAFAGKLLSDLGADVVLVEPRAGARQRWYEPFVDDVPDPERSLWWWHYQAGKRGVTLDLDDPSDAAVLGRLVTRADLVLEAEPPGALAARGLDYPDFADTHPGLVWIAVTPFGRSTARAQEQAVDLTVLASGGPVWSCGYDDHSIPPVRGGGNQGYHTASLHAVIAALVAILHRDLTGRGQFVDLSMHAAANVTTEFASYTWLVSRETVQRQTCRHASVRPTQMTMARDLEGRYVPTGVPPRTPREFQTLLDWLDDLGLRDEFPEAFFLEMGIQRGGVSHAEITDDAEAREIMAAGRDAMAFIAGRLSAYEYFLQGQQRGLAIAVIYAPEEVMADVHYKARGFPVELWHEELGRTVTYPGAPFHMHASPWRLRGHAPRLGQHNEEVLGELTGEMSSGGVPR